MRSLMARISGSSDEIATIAMPSSGKLSEQLVHLGLGRHVDAARRLVDDQHLRLEGQPARQHDLLLVAAREVRDLLLGTGHADAERPAVLLDQPALPPVGHEPEGGRQPAHGGHRHIGPDRQRQEQRLLLAILRHEPDPERDGVRGRADLDRLFVDVDGAAGERVGTEDGARQFGAARADEAREAENLAGLHRKRDVEQPCRMRVERGHVGAEPFHAQGGGPRPGGPALDTGQRAEVAPDHHADHRIDREVRLEGRRGHRHGADELAVPQHGRPVADGQHFVEPVGNVDDRDAAALQAAHDGRAGDRPRWR